MKKLMITVLLAAGLGGLCPHQSKAQSTTDCIEQLLLDYEKLASLKNMLGQMYNGYEVLAKGYNAVKGVAKGNFSLHELFLDGLYLVNPAVRRYPRVADIISDQAVLISEYRQASGAFNRSGYFKPAELTYMIAIYDNLISSSLQNLDGLVMVVTDSQLRMSDAERLTAIDRLYEESHNQLIYIRRFNDQATAMAKQRALVAQDKQDLKTIYGIKP